MGLIQESDVQKLMQNQELMAEIATALIDETTALDKLADEIADKMEDAFEDSPEVRQQIISAAVANPEFKKKLVAKLAKELS